jgi:hypothetical protein
LVYPSFAYKLEGLWHYEWPQHTIKASACDDLSYRSGNEFESSFPVSCGCYALATLGYCFLGWSKLDTYNTRKTHPRSFLAFSKAVGLG